MKVLESWQKCMDCTGVIIWRNPPVEVKLKKVTCFAFIQICVLISL